MGTATWAAGPTDFSWKRSSALGTAIALHALALLVMLAPPAAVETQRKEEQRQIVEFIDPPPKPKIIEMPPPPTVTHTPKVQPQPVPVRTPDPPPIHDAAPDSPMTTVAKEVPAIPTTRSVVESGPSPPGYGTRGRIPYPREAAKRHEQGTVVLRVLVGIDGTPQQVEIETSSGSSHLDRAAREAVAKWRFTPGLRDGVPYAAWGLVPIQFNLNDL